MFSAGINLLTIGGTLYTAYEAFHQDHAMRRIVLVSAAAGLAASLVLQTLAGTFSEDASKKSWAGRVFSFLVREFASLISGVALPLAVAFGYAQKVVNLINDRSMGLVKIEQHITLGRWEVAQLYPVFVGGNFGFMVGQTISAIYRAVS